MKPLVQADDVESFTLQPHHLRRIERSLPVLTKWGREHNRPPDRSDEEIWVCNAYGQIGELGVYLWFGEGELGFQDYCMRRDKLDVSQGGDGQCDLRVGPYKVDVKSTLIAGWTEEHIHKDEYSLRVRENEIRSTIHPDYYILVHVEMETYEHTITNGVAHVIGFSSYCYIAHSSFKYESSRRLSPLLLRPINDLLLCLNHEWGM